MEGRARAERAERGQRGQSEGRAKAERAGREPRGEAARRRGRADRGRTEAAERGQRGRSMHRFRSSKGVPKKSPVVFGAVESKPPSANPHPPHRVTILFGETNKSAKCRIPMIAHRPTLKSARPPPRHRPVPGWSRSGREAQRSTSRPQSDAAEGEGT